jgi:hypothetical protein
MNPTQEDENKHSHERMESIKSQGKRRQIRERSIE